MSNLIGEKFKYAPNCKIQMTLERVMVETD